MDVHFVDALDLFVLGAHVLANTLEVNGILKSLSLVRIVDQASLCQRRARLAAVGLVLFTKLGDLGLVLGVPGLRRPRRRKDIIFSKLLVNLSGLRIVRVVRFRDSVSLRFGARGRGWSRFVITRRREGIESVGLRVLGRLLEGFDAFKVLLHVAVLPLLLLPLPLLLLPAVAHVGVFVRLSLALVVALVGRSQGSLVSLGPVRVACIINTK